ncbi:hypothetical protein CLOM_g3426 [Closterium sp. NIES-68]|nr:hypothetical protein CLOM_g3426 [Closterium sp. NIES-68]GJP65735.1 hypothetical protein CLOP_g22598 [Closterium sp. NIES-67]
MRTSRPLSGHRQWTSRALVAAWGAWLVSALLLHARLSQPAEALVRPWLEVEAEGRAVGRAHWRRTAGAQEGLGERGDGERFWGGTVNGEDGAGGVRDARKETQRQAAEGGGLPHRGLQEAQIGGEGGDGGEGSEGGEEGYGGEGRIDRGGEREEGGGIGDSSTGVSVAGDTGSHSEAESTAEEAGEKAEGRDMEGHAPRSGWAERGSDAHREGSMEEGGGREAREGVEVAAAGGEGGATLSSGDEVLFHVPPDVPLAPLPAAAGDIEEGEEQQGESGAEAWRGDARVREQVASKPADLRRVAVCLVGGARDFEMTGPSIVQRLLLPLLPHRPVLFLHAPLDEASFKLWALLWAAQRGVAVGGVRVFPSTWVNESALPMGVVEDPSSPHGTQGMLQYFRLVEGCIALIRGYERRHVMAFDWVLRTRVDTFWHGALPPLSAFPLHAYTIPFGSDCFGLNDRFGLGTWQTALPALSRLAMLPAIAVRGAVARFSMAGLGGLGDNPGNTHAVPVEVPTGLNSEQAFKAQLAVAGVPVARADLSFCVVSRRVYRHHSMPVLSLNASTPLNGAKCRPCKPKMEGALANERIRKWYLEGSRFGPHRSPGFAKRTGFALCDAAKPWVSPVADNLFDTATGPQLARERQSIMHVSLRTCARNFRQLRRHAEEWQAAAAAVVCFRSQLGQLHLLGPHGASFYTALEGVNSTSRVVSTTPRAAQAKGTWEWTMRRKTPHLGVTALSAASAHASSTAHTLKLSLTGADLPLVSDWQQHNSPFPACQLLLAFPDELALSHRNATITTLQQLGFHLMACIQEPRVTVERCSFFSVKHCAELLGRGQEARVVN